MKQLLNEIDSLQAKINQNRPFDKETLKKLQDYFRIDATYTSNALEGNSLTLCETKVVIEDGLTIGGKPLRDHLEATGHNLAYNEIFKLVKNQEISEANIKLLHKIFYTQIDNLNAGHYRKVIAFISGSKYPLPAPDQLPDLMERLPYTLKNLRQKYHPVVFAAMAHLEFVFIHPFIDGNGRIARLLMNLALLQSNFCLGIISNENRPKYIAALEEAHENNAHFLQFIAERVKETQEQYLKIFHI